MSSILLTEPATLAEANPYLHVDQDDLNNEIAALSADARVYIETHTRRALITQTLRFSRDA
jgi:hypothetical protein